MLASAGALALVAMAAGVGAGPAGAAAPADPARQGYIGLCDGTGHNITSGNVNSAPFVWKAVSSQAPPSAYAGKGQNADLNIYQLRPGVPAAEWSGEQLTAASFYRQKAAPTAQATTVDLSLANIIADYPPMDGGRYELRMYVGKVNYGDYSATYPATFIQVSGSTWHVIDGGTVNCGAADAVSDEVLTGALPKADANPANLHTTAPQPASSASGSTGRGSGRGGGGGSAARTNSAAPGAAAASGDGALAPGGAAAAGDSSAGSSGATPVLAWVGVAAGLVGLVLVVTGARWWARGGRSRSLNGREHRTS
jgi:hypothetical protein